MSSERCRPAWARRDWPGPAGPGMRPGAGARSGRPRARLAVSCGSGAPSPGRPGSAGLAGAWLAASPAGPGQALLQRSGVSRSLAAAVPGPASPGAAAGPGRRSDRAAARSPPASGPARLRQAVSAWPARADRHRGPGWGCALAHLSPGAAALSLRRARRAAGGARASCGAAGRAGAPAAVSGRCPRFSGRPGARARPAAAEHPGRARGPGLPQRPGAGCGSWSRAASAGRPPRPGPMARGPGERLRARPECCGRVPGLRLPRPGSGVPRLSVPRCARPTGSRC